MSGIPPLFDLTGRVALVAGATRGIGRSIARQFVEHGGSVILASRDPKACAEFAAELNRERSDDVAWPQSFDLSDPQSIDDLVRASEACWGRLDTLVANSYRAVAGPASTTSDADFVAVLRDNIVHNSRMAHAALPALQRRRGSVIFIASASGLAPSPSMAAYGIAKRGLIHLTQNLAVEWAPLGVRVNAVAPGMTRTPVVTGNLSEQSLSERSRSWPIARLAEPDEIAATALFLAAPAAGYVTGHVLVADGGRTLQTGNSAGSLDFG